MKVIPADLALDKTIRRRRVALGISQESLARRTELSLSVVQKIEYGQVSDPHLSTVLALASALELTVCEFLEEVQAKL